MNTPDDFSRFKHLLDNIDTKHKIVLQQIYWTHYDGCSFDIDCFPVNWTHKEMIGTLDYFVEDMADQYYDEDVFPIIATPNIRNTLNIPLLVNKIEDIAWTIFVEDVFDNDCY